MSTTVERCHCGDDPCMYVDCGYPFCRPCGEHHRSAECAVDEQGRPLAPCGCTREELEAPGYYDRPCRHDVVQGRCT